MLGELYPKPWSEMTALENFQDYEGCAELIVINMYWMNQSVFVNENLNPISVRINNLRFICFGGCFWENSVNQNI